MAKVFLSHSSFDKEYVEQIANKFGKDKAVYDTFSFETGEKTFEQILNALNNTDLFVIFLSDKDIDKAIVFLTENYYDFDNKIYFYKNLFDLYEEQQDIVNMKIAYDELEKAIGKEDTYAPILLRRRFTLMFFNGQRYDNIIAELHLTKIGDYAKKQIIKHLNYLFKV